MSHEGRAVLILGCGYAGTVLAQRLAFRGEPIYGTTRTPDRTSVIRTRGAEPLLVDAFEDLSPLTRCAARARAVVSLIPPRQEADGTWADPTARVLERFRTEKVDAFVYVSSTSVYGDHAGAVVTETTIPEPDSPRGSQRLAVERQVLNSGLPAMVVRPAGIYGPGRSPLHRIATGSYKVIGDGAAYTNRIHVRDLAQIIHAAIDRGEPGRTYLASDLLPSTRQEVVDHVAEAYGLPRPPRMPVDEARIRLTKDGFGMLTGSKRLDPAWTLKSLGVKLRFPDYVSGLAAIWRQEEPAIRALVA